MWGGVAVENKWFRSVNGKMWRGEEEEERVEKQQEAHPEGRAQIQQRSQAEMVKI